MSSRSTGPRDLSAAELQDVAGGDGTIRGTEGRDVIFASHSGSGDFQVYGRGGDDQLVGGDGHDELDGGDGNDNLAGHFGNDTIEGGAGHDILDGQQGNNLLDGESGNDYLVVMDGNATAYGGAGDDTLIWSPDDRRTGDSIFHGEAGNNQVLVTMPLSNFTLDTEVRWSMNKGAIIFEGPASGTFTINGKTLTFTGVTAILPW